MPTLLEYLDKEYSGGQVAFTLRIQLLNGEKMNVAIYKVLEDGLVTDLRSDGEDYDRDERRFIPFASIVFFDVEW